jgi:hypothetical protein
VRAVRKDTVRLAFKAGYQAELGLREPEAETEQANETMRTSKMSQQGSTRARACVSTKDQRHMKDLEISTMKAIADLRARALGDAGEPCIVVGPCCYQRSDGRTAKRWYFSISTCGQDKQFRTDTVTVDPSWGEELDGAEAARASFLRLLMT